VNRRDKRFLLQVHRVFARFQTVKNGLNIVAIGAALDWQRFFPG